MDQILGFTHETSQPWAQTTFTEDQILWFTLETSLLPNTLKREDFYTSLACKDCFYDLYKVVGHQPNQITTLAFLYVLGSVYVVIFTKASPRKLEICTRYLQYLQKFISSRNKFIYEVKPLVKKYYFLTNKFKTKINKI